MTVTIHCTLKQIDYICIIITINMPTRNYRQGYTPTASLEGLAEFNRQRDIESQRRLIALKQLIATSSEILR